jgi:hypothetical protein
MDVGAAVGRGWSLAKAPGRAARRRSQRIDYLAEWVEFEHRLITTNPVIIFSMGKAGTTSLTVALRAGGIPVVKVHSLTKAATAERIWAHHRSFAPGRPRGYWRYDYLRRDLMARPWVRRQMISLVREPVARTISAYFYDLDPTRYDDPLDAHGSEVEARLMQELERDWFASELEPVTGIDVHETPFEGQVGAQRLRRGRFDVLVLRQEDLRSGPTGSALAEFLGRPHPLEIPRRNTGAESAYAELQRRFVSEWTFSRSLLDRTYESRVARHFYSDHERTQLIARWSTGGRTPTDAGREASS